MKYKNQLTFFKIALLCFLLTNSFHLKSQNNIDSLVAISSEIIPSEFEKDFPKLTQVLTIVQKDDKYLNKLYFGNYFFKAPTKFFSKEGLIFIDKNYILNQSSNYENAILWNFLLALGTIHSTAETKNQNINYVLFHKARFSFALSTLFDIVKQTQDCKLAKFGLNAIYSGSKKMTNDLNQMSALEQIVEGDLYKKIEIYYGENNCVTENGEVPRKVNDKPKLSQEALNSIKQRISQNNLKRNCISSTPELLEKSIGLLSDFDSTVNLSQNVTIYKYKRIPERFYTSTVFAKIVKNKIGCYTFLLRFFDEEGYGSSYDLSFNNKIYTFKKGNTPNSNSTIETNVHFTNFLVNSTDAFKSLQEFLNDRDASIYINGYKTNKIDISYRERTFIQKTLDLFISLTNYKID